MHDLLQANSPEAIAEGVKMIEIANKIKRDVSAIVIKGVADGTKDKMQHNLLLLAAVLVHYTIMPGTNLPKLFDI